MLDKEKLDQLEKEAVELHNERITLIESYIVAQKNNSVFDQTELEKEWDELSQKIKSINRRITLLKNQSNELSKFTLLAQDVQNSARWNKVNVSESTQSIQVIPSCNQFSYTELQLLLKLVKKHSAHEIFIDADITPEMTAYINF